MEEENTPGPSTPARWLKILLRDCTREAGKSMILGEGMLGDSARAMIWSMCRYFECHKSAVPALTCRVLEMYVVDLMINRFRDNVFGLAEYLASHLWLLMSCSYHLAARATNPSLRYNCTEIQNFLVAVGCSHSLEDIITTQWAIFFGIDCHIPTFNSTQMADMLAKHIGIDASRLMGLVVQLAELHRFDVEAVTRRLAAQRQIQYGSPRVYTLHLAAGCVAAAVQRASLAEPERTARQLATAVQVSSAYIEVLREAVLVTCVSSAQEVEVSRTGPLPPSRVLRNNTARKNTGHPYSRRSEGSEPGTSK